MPWKTLTNRLTAAMDYVKQCSNDLADARRHGLPTAVRERDVLLAHDMQWAAQENLRFALNQLYGAKPERVIILDEPGYFVLMQAK
jgi:hypothetical protein